MQRLVHGKAHLVAFLIVLGEAEHKLVTRDVLEHAVETADVVGVGMGIDGIVDMGNAQIVQQRVKELPFKAGAVDEHAVIAIAHIGGVHAEDLGEIDFQQLGVRVKFKGVVGVLDLVDDDFLAQGRHISGQEDEGGQQRKHFLDHKVSSSYRSRPALCAAVMPQL